MIDAKSAFGIVADGSDETTKINAAFAAAGGVEAGELLYFGPGIYGCDGLDQLTGVRNFIGTGMRKTTFKNLSPTARLFDFEPGAGAAAWGSSFMRAQGFSIDQNGCSGSAIRLNVQYNGLRDVWVRNQGGGASGSFAISLHNATLADLDNVHVSNSDNCLEIDTCYYVNTHNTSLERQKGKALKSVGCAQLQMSGLYLDHGNPGAVGFTVPAVLDISSCTTLLINGMSTEIADAGTLAPNVAIPNSTPVPVYCVFNGVENGVINGLRVNHSAASTSAYILNFEDSSVLINGAEWFETRQGTTLFGVKPNNVSLGLRGVKTRNRSPGVLYGLGAWNGKSKRVTVEDWTDLNAACQIYMQAADIMATQVAAPINLFSADVGKRHFVNCQSITGAGAAGSSCVNTPII